MPKIPHKWTQEPSVVKRFSDKYEKGSSCWLWVAGKNNYGYGAFVITKGFNVGAHVFSYTLFIGEVPNNACVLHKCDTPACVNPSHLFLGDQRANMLDMIAKGRNSLFNSIKR